MVYYNAPAFKTGLGLRLRAEIGPALRGGGLRVFRSQTAFVLVFFLALAALPAGGADSVFTGNPQAEGKARGGADLALSRHALCMRTNPAGMGLIEGNREDFYLLAMFNKLDWRSGSPAAWTNGDAPGFGLNAGYVFTPSRLLADPLFIWTKRTEKDAPYMEGGFMGHGTLSAPVRMPPPAVVAFRIKGIGFRAGEIAIRAEVAEDSVIRTYSLPEPEPIPGQPVVKVEVAFSWKQEGTPQSSGSTVNLKAYGESHSVMLDRVSGAWAPGSVAIPIGGALRPAEIELTVVGESAVEVKDVVVLRTVLTDTGSRLVRTPVAYESMKMSVDEGVSAVTLDSTSAVFDGKASEEEVFLVPGFGHVNPMKIKSISVSYRFGFSGQGRIGSAVLAFEGRAVAAETHTQPRVLTLDEERYEYLKKSIKRFEEDKFHLGAAVFTDAWLAADYNDTSTRVGLHEEQIRYAMFSISPAVAYKLADGLSIGACVDVYYSRFSNFDSVLAQPPSIMTGPGGTFGNTGAFYAARTGNDAVMIQFDTDKLSAFGAGGRIGVIYEPDPAFSVGVAASLPTFLSGHIGTAKADFSDDFFFSGFENDLQTGVSLPMGGQFGFEGKYDVVLSDFGLPATIGAGVAVRPHPDLLIALDVTYMPWTWTSRDRITIEFRNGTNPDVNAITGGNFKVRIPFRLDDQIAVAVGMSADVTEEITLHFGYRWSNNPLASDDILPLFPVHIENQASFGVTLKIFTLEFHLAVTHGFAKTVTAGKSSHSSELDGARLYAQENTLLLGVSYRY